MAKRTYWTKLNHDDARLAIDMMDDAEIGRWFRGFLAGSSGKEYDAEKASAWPVEMRSGFSSGRESFADAERFSQKQRDRVSKRYQQPTETLPDATTVTSGSENATETLPTNNQQPTTNNEQHPPAPQGAGEGVENEAQRLWDSSATGLPPVGIWSPSRRSALSNLRRVEPMDDLAFLLSWRRAVTALAANPWAVEQRVNIDYLLNPTHFRRYLDAWTPPKPVQRNVFVRAPPLTEEESKRLRENREVIANLSRKTAP